MTIHFSMGIIWFSFIALALGKVRHLISDGKLKKKLEALSGVVFIGLGLKMALAKN